MTFFRVVSVEPLSATGTATSSAIDKLEDALDFARDLVDDGVDVLRIEDAAGAVVKDAGEVKAWCAAADATPR